MTEHPTGTLIALPAELVRYLALYLSSCSEAYHNEPDEPSHALVKAVEHHNETSVLVPQELATASERMFGRRFILETQPDTTETHAHG